MRKELLVGKDAAGLLQLGVRVRITRKDGVVEEDPWRRSESFTQQFLQMMESAFEDASKGSVRDTINTLRTIAGPNQASTSWMELDTAAADDTKGMQVGTGTTAPTVADYVMEALIAHGVGGGQLQYGTTEIIAPIIVSGNVELRIHRGFTNGSGGPITVKEIGLTVWNQGTYEFLIVRDLYEFTIADGDVAVVEYKLITTT